MRSVPFLMCAVLILGCEAGSAPDASAPARPAPAASTSTAAAAGPVKEDERPLLTNTNTAGQPEAGQPAQNSAHATQTTTEAVTGTHLARKP